MTGSQPGPGVGEQDASLAAFRGLERWLAGASAEQLGLPSIERECERRGRELLRLMLQAHLDGRGDGDVGARVELECPDGPLLLARKRQHARRLLTLFGEVRITRMAYAATGQPSPRPLDAELELPGRACSYELCRRLVRAAVLGPFEEAVAYVAQATGVGAPKRSAEQIVREAAADFASFYEKRAGSDASLEEGEILVGAIDCKGIPMVKPEGATKTVRPRKGEKPNKKRMATVAAVFGQSPRVRTPESVVESLFGTAAAADDRKQPSRPRAKRVWASLVSDKDGFIGDVAAETARRDPRREHSWVIVTDGERALQQRVGRIFGDDVTLILDLLHLLEKLWTAAYAFHPEGSPEAAVFVRDRALRVLRGQVSGVVKGLRQMATKHRLGGNKRKPLLGAAAYCYSNRGRMRYDLYLERGWPIASASVEGACKNLIKHRMERSGMRWTPPMAEAMLRLRATHLSGDLDAYWEHHVEQDQQPTSEGLVARRRRVATPNWNQPSNLTSEPHTAERWARGLVVASELLPSRVRAVGLP